MTRQKTPHELAVELADRFFPRDSAMYRRLVDAIIRLIENERRRCRHKK